MSKGSRKNRKTEKKKKKKKNFGLEIIQKGTFTRIDPKSSGQHQQNEANTHMDVSREKKRPSLWVPNEGDEGTRAEIVYRVQWLGYIAQLE